MKQNSNVTPLQKKDLEKDKKIEEQSVVSSLSPREIVSELDRYVIGQKDAKEQLQLLLETDGEDRH